MLHTFQKFVVALLFVLPMAIVHADDMAPDVLVKNTTLEVTGILKRDKASLSTDNQKLYALIDAKVLPHFDFAQMTQ